MHNSHCNSNKVCNSDPTHEVSGWVLSNKLAKVEQRDSPGELGTGKVKVVS
jgi:hypothetical protein